MTPEEKARRDIDHQLDQCGWLVQDRTDPATGIFYAQSVKANVLFFDARPARERPWTERLWVYDSRTKIHVALKNKTLKQSDLDDFVACFKPENRRVRTPIWGEAIPEGRWRSFEYEKPTRRDKLNLDILWMRDTSLEDSDNLPEPQMLALEIAADLQAAMELFAGIAADLKE